jgi:hypothetical protein
VWIQRVLPVVVQPHMPVLLSNVQGALSLVQLLANKGIVEICAVLPSWESHVLHVNMLSLHVEVNQPLARSWLHALLLGPIIHPSLFAVDHIEYAPLEPSPYTAISIQWAYTLLSLLPIQCLTKRARTGVKV